MVSQIKVNEIIKQSGSSITIGETNDTITLPATATLTNFPAMTPSFHASMPSDSSVANTTYTTLPCSTELYDTDSTYNNSTYVFTPATSGKYFIYAQTKPDTATDFNDSIIKIKKNGSDIIFYARRNTNSDSVSCCGVVEANTTDYFHAEYYQASGGTINIQGSGGTRTFFGAYKVIGA
jgi:hypothetical protein